MPDTRRNLQVKQDGIAYEPEGNGWPDPLVSNSTPLKMKVSSGSNGGSNQMESLKTSQQKTGGWSAPEGSYGDQAPGLNVPNTFNSPQRAKLEATPETSQQIVGAYNHLATGPYSGDNSAGESYIPGNSRGNIGANPQTSQQVNSEHHRPEGE